MSTKEKPKLIEEIGFPENLSIELDNGILKFSSPAGNNEKRFDDPRIIIKKDSGKLILTAKQSNRNSKRTLKTFKAHINNIIRGLTKPYIYKLKICSGHFPMSVSVSGNKVVIKNFFAEKIPREAKILKNVDVKINSDIITVTGSDKELVGQTSANIEQACRITNKDRRVFMDGIYIISKNEE